MSTFKILAKKFYWILVMLMSFAWCAHGALEEQRLACFYYDRSATANIGSLRNFFFPDLPWLWARGDKGDTVHVVGALHNGFFRVDKLFGRSKSFLGFIYSQVDYNPHITVARRLCQNALEYAFGKEGAGMRLLKIAARPTAWSSKSSEPIFLSKQQPISRMVIFGDSLSDQGNLKASTGIFPGAEYFAGRYSNGPIWVDFFKMVVWISVQNWAKAGAVSQQHFDLNLNNKKFDEYLRIGLTASLSSCVRNQIDRYYKQALNRNRLPPAEAASTLFSLWIGGNDYLNQFISPKDADIFIDHPEDPFVGYKVVVRRVTDNILANLSRLYDIGARNFMVANLPDLGAAPFIQMVTTYHQGSAESIPKKTITLSKTLHELSRLHNERLEQLLLDFKKKHLDALIVRFDAHQSLSEALQAKNDAYGKDFNYDFDNSLRVSIEAGLRKLNLFRPCLTISDTGATKICASPDRAPFWDGVHPTFYGHCLWAFRIHSTLAVHNLFSKPNLEQYLSICRPDLVRSMVGGRHT